VSARRLRRSHPPATVRLAVALVLLLPLAAACGPIEAQRDSIKLFCTPHSDAIQKSLVLVAQAVPTATLLPCVNGPPEGWTFSSFDARSGQVDVWFDSDRAGMRALDVTLVAACRIQGTTEPSDELKAPDLRVKIAVSGDRVSGTRYYRFPGGCLMERFDFPIVGDTVLLTDTAIMIDLTPRAELVARLAREGLSL
jgi:hypothetical protein